jgi:hypothetical protein
MFDIPLFFMMIFLFIFAGNRNLKDLGSKTKNLFSVSSITILGAIVASLVYSDQDRMSPLFLYWGYIAPLGAILDAMNIDYIGSVKIFV